jgi:hypothetical protein
MRNRESWQGRKSKSRDRTKFIRIERGRSCSIVKPATLSRRKFSGFLSHRPIASELLIAPFNWLFSSDAVMDGSEGIFSKSEPASS